MEGEPAAAHRDLPGRIPGGGAAGAAAPAPANRARAAASAWRTAEAGGVPGAVPGACRTDPRRLLRGRPGSGRAARHRGLPGRLSGGGSSGSLEYLAAGRARVAMPDRRRADTAGVLDAIP